MSGFVRWQKKGKWSLCLMLCTLFLISYQISINHKIYLKMEKNIIYSGQNAKIGCDEKCNKAWGNNNRPKIQLTDDEDDYAFLSDDELGDAPINPGTYEGGQGKPINKENIPNKWCVRECERCVMSKPNEFDKPLILKDFSKRIFNRAYHSA